MRQQGDSQGAAAGPLIDYDIVYADVGSRNGAGNGLNHVQDVRIGKGKLGEASLSSKYVARMEFQLGRDSGRSFQPTAKLMHCVMPVYPGISRYAYGCQGKEARCAWLKAVITTLIKIQQIHLASSIEPVDDRNATNMGSIA